MDYGQLKIRCFFLFFFWSSLLHQTARERVTLCLTRPATACCWPRAKLKKKKRHCLVVVVLTVGVSMSDQELHHFIYGAHEEDESQLSHGHGDDAPEEDW